MSELEGITYEDAQLYVSDGVGNHPPKAMYLTTAAGYKWVEGVYQSTLDPLEPTKPKWRRIWSKHLNPPQAPAISASIVAGTRNVISVSVEYPAGPRPRRAEVLVDGNYIHSMYGRYAWSDFTNQSSKEYTHPGLGENVVFSARVQDEHGLWSAWSGAPVHTVPASQTPPGMNKYITVVAPSSVKCIDAMTGRDLYDPQTPPLAGARNWVMDPRNPHWWFWQGGAAQAVWQTTAMYPDATRVLQAGTVSRVFMPLTRRWDTDANIVAGRRVDPAALDGNQHRTRLRVDTQTGPLVEFALSGWLPGTTQTVELPTGIKLSSKFTFTDGGSSVPPVSDSVFDASFAMPSTQQGVAKLCKETLSGYLVIEWYSVGSNPWPEADPAHPGFVPLGVAKSVWESA